MWRLKKKNAHGGYDLLASSYHGAKFRHLRFVRRIDSWSDVLMAWPGV